MTLRLESPARSARQLGPPEPIVVLYGVENGDSETLREEWPIADDTLGALTKELRRLAKTPGHYVAFLYTAAEALQYDFAVRDRDLTVTTCVEPLIIKLKQFASQPDTSRRSPQDEAGKKRRSK